MHPYCLFVSNVAALLCAVGVLFSAVVSAAPPPDRVALERLSGTYASSAPERWGEAWGTREFSFERGAWSLRFVLALDPQMAMPVFEFRTHGPYQVLAASRQVPGAFDAVFFEDAKYVTLRTADAKLAAAFGLAGCGLTPGVEKDISMAGCAAWKPVAQCREDHDLLALAADGGLHFGVRPRDNDMCAAGKRPAALLPAVIKR